MRITKTVIGKKFELLARELNWNITDYNNLAVPYYKIDHNSVYGGYRLDYRVKGGHGESWFAHDSQRRSAREMYSYLCGMLAMVDELKRDEQLAAQVKTNENR